MDFQGFVDSFFAPTCVVSVRKLPDGGYGEIRLVAGNKKYTDMATRRVQNTFGGARPEFVPNSLYTDYFPMNRSFDEVCYQAAVEKKEVHTCAHISNIDVWFDISALPLAYEDGDLCYCTYTSTPAKGVDKLVDTFSASKTSSDVLKTCIKLHKATNLKEAMENVIREIRLICKAEGCTVLLINNDEEEYSILASDYVQNSGIKRVTEFKNFYAIANSWKDMIGEQGGCIIIRDEKDMEYVSKINHPWYLTLVEAGVKSVVLFPLRQGNELLGFIWAINFDTDNTMRIKETLELTTFFASSHIARYKDLKRLEHMSYTDVLTGLPNRFASIEYTSAMVKTGEKFTVVSIDLNNLKRINDSFGFDAGNQVLIDVAKRWTTVGAREDSSVKKYLARIAGDEYLVVLSEYQSEEELRSVISKYVEALKENLTVDGFDLHVSASFGYAEYPTDGATLDTLISHANTAMKEIKRANSSEHVLRFAPEMLREERLIEIENKIVAALEKDLIYFNLQPQYDMNHKLRGFEALARMKDADGKFISPGEFIPVAEKLGLIDRVDGTVFRKAIDFFGEVLRKSGADLMLSVNASARHLMKSDFVDEIRGILAESGVPASKLEIEITESIMLDSEDKAFRCIDELKSMGIQIAIDDFGTGYSSLSYLNKLPADILKIDKAFIDAMNTSDSSRQYVAAIISIGHIMGFDVISEGVEEEDQLETLRNIGCDFVQGYIWGRPLPADEAEKVVMESVGGT